MRPPLRPFLPALFFAFGLWASGCTGHIGGPKEEVDLGACGVLEPGPSPIRRMTHAEYDATVRDLLGDDTQPGKDFVIEEEALGFDNQATSLTVTQLLAEQYMKAAEDIAERAVVDLPKLLGCDPVKAGDACVTPWISAFGKRAFRRPLGDDEASALLELYHWGKSEVDVATGIEVVLEAILQSPHFLYRVELGTPDPVANDVVPLNDYEMASRLSYLLWGTMPDTTLFGAADRGELHEASQIEDQARRMLGDPRARSAVARFHLEWLGLTHIEEMNKDAAVYPEFYGDLRPLYRDEAVAMLDHVVFDGTASIDELFTAPYTFMNAELANFFGVSGPTGEAFVKVTPTAPRAGLLTLPAVLATYAKQNQSSPVHRGKFVRERLLCQLLPPPPNDIKIEAPDVDPNATTREKFAEHAENPACAGCHQKMDPIGFGLENYDGIGRYRDLDHGLPVDASGTIIDTVDADGDFDGALELGKRLAESVEVRQCIATQWFRFGYGRAEKQEDQCSMETIQRAFAESGYDVRELLVALTQTPAFRYRHAVVPEARVVSSGGRR